MTLRHRLLLTLAPSLLLLAVLGAAGVYLLQRVSGTASRKARRTATDATALFAVGLVVAAGLAVLLGWWTGRAILRSIQDVTGSARAIGLGDLDHVVPVASRDELGDLAESFNRMARQL